MELTTSDADAFVLPGIENNLTSALRMHLDWSPDVARLFIQYTENGNTLGCLFWRRYFSRGDGRESYS